jgi:hypothetical protein
MGGKDFAGVSPGFAQILSGGLCPAMCKLLLGKADPSSCRPFDFFCTAASACRRRLPSHQTHCKNERIRFGTNDQGGPCRHAEVQAGSSVDSDEAADFGVNWKFNLKLEKILPVGAAKKMKSIERHGKAPRQYQYYGGW